MSDTHAAEDLGITEKDAGDGHAVCELVIKERHLNRQGACHGGILFMLADSAMALASNTGPATAVASQASVNFTAGARLGDRLVARAKHAGGAGKSRIFDVEITNYEGEKVALFRGTTITIAQK